MKSEVSSFRVHDSRDSVKVEQMMVAVSDSLHEITTITITENENGDTLRVARVTERDRVRDRAQVKDQHERVVMKTDTVYVAVRDSTAVSNTNLTNPTNRASPVVLTLKWVFWIIIAIIALIVTIKLSRIIRI